MSWTDEQLRRFRAEMNTLGDEGCWFLSEREDPIVMKESDSVQSPRAVTWWSRKHDGFLATRPAWNLVSAVNM